MKTALVTGCLGSIGQGICNEFRDSGYQVVGMDARTKAEEWTGPYYQADLTDLDATLAAVQDIIDTIGVPEVLVNNAGVFKPQPFFDVTPDAYDLTLDVNAKAVFFLSQRIAQELVAQGKPGAIVNVSSISGVLGSAVTDYATSKGGVIAMTKSLGRVLAPHNIRVNAVAPGMIESQMTEALSPAQLTQHLAVVPMQRLGEPAEVARLVRFLASDEASYLTSTTVNVAGGWIS